MYSCRLEPLTSVHECKLTPKSMVKTKIVLALFSYVGSVLCIDIYSFQLKPSHEAMSNNARATKHICRS